MCVRYGATLGLVPWPRLPTLSAARCRSARSTEMTAAPSVPLRRFNPVAVIHESIACRDIAWIFC